MRIRECLYWNIHGYCNNIMCVSIPERYAYYIVKHYDILLILIYIHILLTHIL